MSRRRLIVLAARGSGGAVTHLREVIPRILAARPDWDAEVYAPAALLEDGFGRADERWMRPIKGGNYRSRLFWELGRLTVLARGPRTLVYSPFGPHLNVALAPRTVWSSRNIIPLLDPREWEVSRDERPRLHALRQLFRVSARLSPRVVCVSRHARERLVALAGVAPDKIAVVPHGSDGSRGPAGLDQTPVADLADRGFILSVGQPTPYRRTRELIRGYARIANRPGVPPLVIVGQARAIDDGYGRACLADAGALLAAGRIRMLGQRSSAETLAMTAAATVVAYPSVHEDCPNAILEALSAGRPIVCADVPATRELAEDAAILVPDPRDASIASALELALFDLPLREKLEAAARRRASRYTWSAASDATANVLDDAFSKLETRTRGNPRAAL